MTKTVSALTKNVVSSAAATDFVTQIKAEMPSPAVVIVFASSKHDYKSLLEIIADGFSEALVLGCSSAGEFNSMGQGEGSISGFAIASDEMAFSASMAENISSRPDDAAKQLLSSFRGLREEGYRYRTALILNDALAGCADELVQALNLQTGGKYKFFGGGAGDDAAFAKTHVFLGTKIATNAAVALEILSTKPVGVGVRHGWKPATELMRVTDSSGTILGSLDAVPAADIFEEYARGTDQSFDAKAPIPFFLHNIMGVKSEQGYKLRVPLSVNENRSIAFAAEVPVSSSVSIMSASAGSSTDAARDATDDAVKQLGDSKPGGALMFDCVATRLRLGKEFGSELDAVRTRLGNVPLAGCNTYGQVASAEGQFTGFHNCTAVVCVFPE